MAVALVTPTRRPSEPIDVIDNKDEIIPLLEIVVNDDVPYGLREDALQRVSQFGGDFPKEKVVSLLNLLTMRSSFIWDRDNNYGLRSTVPSVTYRRLQGETICWGSIDAKVTGSVIEGRAPLAHAVRPNITDSFLLGDRALSGSSDGPNWTSEQYHLFMQMQDSIMAKDPVKILQGLVAFGKTLSREQHEDALRYVGGRNRQVIDFVIQGLIAEGFSEDYPPHITRMLAALQQDERVAAAAHILYTRIDNMARRRDAYQISVNNSVVAGDGAVSNVKGGAIDNSIIAGKDALSGSNVNVRNTHVVTPKGVRFIQNEMIGNPSLYETLPVSLTDPKGLFRAMDYYRGPAISRHFKVRVY